MWNLNQEILKTYNLITHELRNRKLILDNNTYLITNVFKEWNQGWYYSLELKCLNNSSLNKYYIKIPYKNLNCENNEILERIKLSNQKIQLLEV